MKKLAIFLFLFLTLSNNAFASEKTPLLKAGIFDFDVRGVKSALNSQVKYANKADFEKFISTYDETYVNADGFNLETYSKLVKDLWKTYDNIKYGIKIKDVKLHDDMADVSVTETSYANVPISAKMNGVLKSSSNSIYYLKKINGKWKVVSDKVIDEKTSMLYGEAANLDIKLSAPLEVEPGYEYTASLEFVPPKDTFAIASIAKDKVEYPQKQAKEVFRKLPDDNILERLFISNKDNANEYVIASIGLTRADIQNMNIKLSLTGFGYQIIRVNVVQPKNEDKNEQSK